MSLRQLRPVKGAYRPRYLLQSNAPTPRKRTAQAANWAIGAPHSKLLISDVLKIRKRWQMSGGQRTRFARKEVARLRADGVAISMQAVMQVLSRESWSWVPDV